MKNIDKNIKEELEIIYENSDKINKLEINSNLNSNKIYNLEFFSNLIEINVKDNNSKIKILEEFTDDIDNYISDYVIDNIIPNTVSGNDGIIWDSVLNKYINTITQYTDDNVENILSNKNYLTIDNIPLNTGKLHIYDNKLDIIDSNILSINNEGENISIVEDTNGFNKINVGKLHYEYKFNINKFYYTDSEQYFDIPSNVNEIQVYIWGAGGAGSKYENGGCGGSGGYAEGIINVSDINRLYIHVGSGGKCYINSTSDGGYLYGGEGGIEKGAGGGKSGIYINSISDGNEILIAGGGGGAGGMKTLNGNIHYCNGGAGGGYQGNDAIITNIEGINESFVNTIAKGANYNNYGLSGKGDLQSLNGSRSNGGDSSHSGGGGSGYWGGGGGGRNIEFDCSGAGGGGSGYKNDRYVKNAVLQSSQNVIYDDIPIEPVNSDNKYYVNTVGKGGINNGGYGGNGLVIILYKSNELNQNYKLSYTELSTPNNNTKNITNGVLVYNNDEWIVSDKIYNRVEYIEDKIININ